MMQLRFFLALCLLCSACSTSEKKFPVRMTVYWKYPCSDRWTHKGKTSTGKPLKEMRTVAVDPKVIPYFSEFIIESNPPLKVVAEDTGSAVKNRTASRQTGGQPVVDVFFNHKRDAKEFASNNPEIVNIIYRP